ncbi:MAG: hypothetical protein CVU47_02470 [Chloroflexi bacterium HGW-Chloroflexi-9]|nr:MAG: hypothetical protein CVU47_02470 [Chloroflexi bacterium HGW-Chloroflexi-9]
MRPGLFSRWSVRAASLLLIAFVVACSGGGDDEDGAGPAAAGVDVDQPRVIITGALLAPPYEVTVQGATVQVNGARSTSFERPPAPAPEPVDANATLDAFKLVELARLAYLGAGGGSAGVDAAVAAVQGRADVSGVEVSEAAGVTRITVTDSTGFAASLVPEPVDNASRDASDEERTAAATEVATSIRAHLESGGGLVVAASGTTLMIPAPSVPTLLEDTDRAIGLSGEQQRSALLAIYEDESIVDEVIAHYEPRETSARLVPPVPGARPHSIADRRAASGASGGDEQGAATSSKTPASKKAWVMVTLYWTDAQGFITALQKENYEVRIYNFYDHVQPAGSGWNAFRATSRSGAVYYATHSDATGLSLQSFATNALVADALTALRAVYDAGDISWWKEADGTWWLSATPQGIRNHWQSADTIVHSASCYSITLAGAFNAREFFGYEPTTSCNIATPDTNRLWQRLTGEERDGELREASRAFAEGGFSAGFRYVDGSPDDGTVLSPSVVDTGPDEPLFVGGEGFVLVRFDANMDRTVSPALVVTISGCAERITEGEWQVANVLTIPVRATSPGTAEVRVSARHALSELGKIALDGNQNPAGKNGVAHNQDDYLFDLQCVALVDPTPTGTTGLQPPTETPSGGGGEVIQVGSGDPERPGYVRVPVLVYEGEHYPLIQFRIAGPDNCDANHYHADHAVSFEGTTTRDPNPGSCGFGRESEAEIRTVDVAQALVDGMPIPVR